MKLRDEGYIDNPDLLFLMARAVDRGVEVPA